MVRTFVATYEEAIRMVVFFTDAIPVTAECIVPAVDEHGTSITNMCPH